MQSFGGCVHGRCKTRGTGPDNRDIEEFIVFSGIKNSETLRQRDFRRIEQHGAVWTKSQHVGGCRTVLRQECGRRCIVCGVDHLVRVRVATQKGLQSHHRGR